MGRAVRGSRRLLLLAAAGATAWFGFVAWSDRVAPAEALPGGADAAIEARDAAAVVARIEGTRFAAALGHSALVAWLDGTEGVRAFDDLLAQIRAATRLPVRRRHVLDVLGREAAVAWYPGGPAPAAGTRWVAACRLSTRAWALAHAVLLADRAGIAGAGIARERVAGAELLAFPGGAADHAWHAFLVGRLLVIGDDRDLVRRAARSAGGDEPALAADASWGGTRRALPEGDAYLWARGGAPRGALAAGGAPGRPAGAVVRAGRRTEVHLLGGPPAPGAETALSPALPGLGLMAQEPLFFHASRGAPPPILAEALAARQRAVAARAGVAPAQAAPAAPGFLVAITEGAGEGPFPRPRGALAFTARSADAARETVEALFPPGARTAPVAGTTARSTRESLPLAGELEVWGAALGPRVVIATGTAEIAAIAAAPPPASATPLPATPWEVESVTALSGTRALPLLRRYAPFLGALAAARGAGPNLAADVELLGALRSATLLAGRDAAGRRGLLALELGDLPAAP